MKKYLIIILSLSVLGIFAPGCSKAESELIQGTRISVTESTLWFDAAGGSQLLEFRLHADSWTITQTDDTGWCRPEKTSGTTSSAFYVNVEANTGLSRESVLTISAPGYEPAEIHVIQNGLQDDAVSFTPESPDADKALSITYKAVPETPLYGYDGEVYAHIGVVDGDFWQFNADWYVNLDKFRMEQVGDNTWVLRLEPSIREFFESGKTPVNRLGLLIRSGDRTLRAFEENFYIDVTDSRNTLVHEPPVLENVPEGAEYGININADGSVTFVLYERDTEGKSYDHAYLIGDFNEWLPSLEYAMKRDESKGCWWFTLEGTDPSEEYMFQYYLVNEDGKSVRVSDPFSEIVYTSDDRYISRSTYPDMKDYPTETTGLVSAFTAQPDEYIWQNTDFTVEDPDNLIIYELLFRDFSSTGDIKGALEHLDYLQELGINAIELMPVQEFDGNSSWGYNPCSYFAMDKAYGTTEDYKRFIDECHQRGIAVILDVVYNHMTGASTLARLYWDAEAGDGGLTAANNPFFNVVAPHPFSVYHDLNHENPFVKEYVGRNLEYLISEFRIDGFRFDLAKGFTNRQSDEGSASREDASRIAILKGYRDRIAAVDPNSVTILELFCDDGEEIAHVNNGWKVWRNLNYAYGQSEAGYYSGSGFDGLWSGSTPYMPFGGYVSYMESHDEERNAFRSKEYAAEPLKSSLDMRMARAALNAAFFFTVPGPKMIWQFEELGYDISIEEGGRTSPKPLHWDYFEVPERKALYDAYGDLIHFRLDNPEFFTSDASFSWNVTEANWSTGRSITCISEGKAFVVAGNFDTVGRNISVELPSVSGTWRNYFDPEETITETNGYVTFEGMTPGEYKILVNFQ